MDLQEDAAFPIPTWQTNVSYINECATARIVKLKSQHEGDEAALTTLFLYVLVQFSLSVKRTNPHRVLVNPPKSKSEWIMDTLCTIVCSIVCTIQITQLTNCLYIIAIDIFCV